MYLKLFSLVIYVKVEMLDQIINVSYTLEETPKLSSSGSRIFHYQQQCMRALVALHPW